MEMLRVVEELKEHHDREDQRSMHRISLIQDHNVVKDFSNNIKKTSRIVKDTNNMGRVVDPDVIRKRTSALQDQMDVLEKKFGYKEDPEGAEAEQDFLKLGKESYGVSISIEHQKAAKQKLNTARPTTYGDKDKSKFVP